jgi:hypothetical protein
MGCLEAGRAESRFLLPGKVETAVLFDAHAAWREGLSEFGVVVDGPRGIRPDLAVCTPASVRQAAESGASMVLVEGRVRDSQLTRAGYQVERYASLPSAAHPHLLIPLGRRAPARFALGTWLAPDRLWKGGRNRLLAAAIGTGNWSLPARSITVASREPPVPRMISATSDLGLPPDAEWILAPAQGDRLSRGVFLVLPPGEGRPSHVVKFARVPGWNQPFELDEAAAALLAGAGDAVTRRVPRLLGRRFVDGLGTSVETAAAGQRLIGFLHTPAPPGAKHSTIDQIAEWVLELGRSTLAAPATLAPEYERMARDLSSGTLVERLSGVPAVLQHNDLGTWNIAVDGPDFTILDWESARRYGLPLWDLWYFLMDAEAHAARAATLDEREEHFARLFGGRIAASERLFRWTRRIASGLGIPDDAIGALATLCWLHHGSSGALREEELSRFDHTAEPAFWLQLLERLRHRWMTDPSLGPDWSAAKPR